MGQYGSKDGEFSYPRGVRLHHGHVYVCDRGNNHIQVFDTDLNFIRRGQFNTPYDLDFDSEGKAYISDNMNRQIQVMDTSGPFVRQFGQEERQGKLGMPTAVHVMGQFVYVSDEGHHHIAVYQTSGQFITSFGNLGKGEGEFDKTYYGITSDQNGFVYVADIKKPSCSNILMLYKSDDAVIVLDLSTFTTDIDAIHDIVYIGGACLPNHGKSMDS